jgi:hypothetical protein
MSSSGAGMFRQLKRWLSLKAGGKKGKKLNDYWSEWQDLNLRPLRPECLGTSFFFDVSSRPSSFVHGGYSGRNVDVVEVVMIASTM